MHQNPKKILWIALNAFKKFGFGVIVFHTASGKAIPEERWLSANIIQPILFFSKLLASAEKNYWPTELEIASFVWVMKKVRHIIESFKSNVII